jgi:hypothetical protein
MPRGPLACRTASIYGRCSRKERQRRPVGLSLFQLVKVILTVWRRNQIERVVANSND